MISTRRSVGVSVTWIIAIGLDQNIRICFAVAISNNEARQLIEKEFDNPDWEEILDFATQTSVAEMIADVIIDRAKTAELSSRLIDRAFHVLARPEIRLAPSKLDAFLEWMFALAQAEDRQKAYRVGVCMANNDMSHVSEVAERSEQLLTAQTEWAKLIGWTVLVCHFPDRIDHSGLENKVLYYAALSNDDNLFIRPNHDDSLIRPMASLLYRGPDRELFELFLINALEALLENLTVARQDRLLAAVDKLQALRTRGSVIRLENLLRRIGRRDALSMFEDIAVLNDLKACVHQPGLFYLCVIPAQAGIQS